MPQNKPMKIQWITVNGRQVPLVLPQTYSYADDDWKVTSDRDPLPIVEYGTTAGGIIVPKRVSDEGHELTQLTGSNVDNVEMIFGEENVEVAAGTIKQVGDYVKVVKYNYFFVQVHTNGSDNFKLIYRPLRGESRNIPLTQRTLIEQTGTTANTFSDRVEVMSLRIGFFIENKMETDHTFGGIYVFGVRE